MAGQGTVRRPARRPQARPRSGRQTPRAGQTTTDADWLAHVHVEIESADSVTDIERRLPAYHFHLRAKYQRPVLPIVLFLKVGLNGLGSRVVTDPFFDEEVLTFRYQYVGLPGLTATDYLDGDNWLGVALAALMRHPKNRVVELGVEAIRRIGDAPLTDGKKSLLGDCVETYIDVPEAETKRFRDILEANATGRVPPVNKTRYQIGKEEGREEGQVRALRAGVTELLEAKFGAVPTEYVERVEAMTDPAALRRVNVAAGTATTFDQFRAAVGW